MACHWHMVGIEFGKAWCFIHSSSLCSFSCFYSSSCFVSALHHRGSGRTPPLQLSQKKTCKVVHVRRILSLSINLISIRLPMLHLLLVPRPIVRLLCTTVYGEQLVVIFTCQFICCFSFGRRNKLQCSVFFAALQFFP